jgi:hypothetical protein
MPYLVAGEILKETEKGLLIYFWNQKPEGFFKTKKAFFFPKKSVHLYTQIPCETIELDEQYLPGIHNNIIKRPLSLTMKCLDVINVPNLFIMNIFRIHSWALRQHGLIE